MIKYGRGSNPFWREEPPAALIKHLEIKNDREKKALRRVLKKLSLDGNVLDDLIFLQMNYYHKRSSEEIMIVFELTSPDDIYAMDERIVDNLKKIIKKNILDNKEYQDV